MNNESIDKPNTVQTILSESSIESFKCILYWFWNEFDPDEFTETIMTMLEVYVKACLKDVHPVKQPYAMTGFVSKSIQLKEQLADIMNDEKPWQWMDTADGWIKPSSVSS